MILLLSWVLWGCLQMQGGGGKVIINQQTQITHKQPADWPLHHTEERGREREREREREGEREREKEHGGGVRERKRKRERERKKDKIGRAHVCTPDTRE